MFQQIKAQQSKEPNNTKKATKHMPTTLAGAIGNERDQVLGMNRFWGLMKPTRMDGFLGGHFHLYVPIIPFKETNSDPPLKVLAG